MGMGTGVKRSVFFMNCTVHPHIEYSLTSGDTIICKFYSSGTEIQTIDNPDRHTGNYCPHDTYDSNSFHTFFVPHLSRNFN